MINHKYVHVHTLRKYVFELKIISFWSSKWIYVLCVTSMARIGNHNKMIQLIFKYPTFAQVAVRWLCGLQSRAKGFDKSRSFFFFYKYCFLSFGQNFYQQTSQHYHSNLVRWRHWLNYVHTDTVHRTVNLWVFSFFNLLAAASLNYTLNRILNIARSITSSWFKY